jgi:putative DNA primase/helicase
MNATLNDVAQKAAEVAADQVANPWRDLQPLHRELPPADPYPIEALGETLAGAVAVVVRVTQPDAMTAAQSALAAASLAAQAHRNIAIDGRLIPLSLDLVTVAASGDRKTASDRALTLPHSEWERELAAEYKPHFLAFKNRLLVWEKARDKAVREAKGMLDGEAALDALGPPPQPPPVPQIKTEEPTYEGLVKLIELGQPSVGLFSDEGGRFIGGHGMSPEQKLKTLAGLSKLWDGDPITRTRAGDGAVTLYGRRVALHLMVQPGIAPQLLADPVALEQGFLSRCLLAWPASSLGHQLYVAEDVTKNPAFQCYADSLRVLLRRRPNTAENDPHELRPIPMQLAPMAKSTWVRFHDWMQRNAGPEGALRPIFAFAAKAPEHALRIAGVLGLVADPDTQEIDLHHVEAGIALARFYLGEALRLQGLGATRTELQAAEKLLSWMRPRGPLVSLVDVYQLGPSAVRDKNSALALIGLLEDHGHIRRVKGGATVGGQYRRDVWEVRP